MTSTDQLASTVLELAGRVKALERQNRPAAGYGSFANVLEYGALGDGSTDDTVAIQRAVDAVYATKTKGVVYLPTGTYVLNDQITFYPGIAWAGDGIGKTILDWNSASGTFTNNACMYAEGGGLTVLPALGADIAQHATTITFAAAPTLVAGDILVIYDSANFSYSTRRTYYRAGEYVQVVSQAGAVITLASPVYAAYASGGTVSVYKLTDPVVTSMQGMEMRFKTGSTLAGIKVAYAKDCIFENLKLYNSDYVHLAVQQGYNCVVSKVLARDFSASISLNYGVGLWNSQRITVSDCHLYTRRHGFDTSSGDWVGCVPNREISIANSLLGGLGTGAGDGGVGTHGNSEYIEYVGCQIIGGAGFGGDHTMYKSCYFRTGTSGVALYGSECIGPNHEVNDCDFDVTANVDASFGVIYSSFQSYTVRSGVMRIKNCRFHLNGHTGYIINLANSAATGELDADVFSNELYGTTGASYLRVRALDDLGWKHVAIKSNKLLYTSIYLDGINAEHLVIADNEVYKAGTHGIYVNANVSPAYVEFMDIRNNTVVEPQQAGIRISGSAATSIARVSNNIVIRCGQAGVGGAAVQTSLYAIVFKDLILENNILGDDQVTATQTRYYNVGTITNFWERNNYNIGPVTTITNTADNTYGGYRAKGLHKDAYSDAVPTAGTWGVGDIVWDPSPTASNPPGWVCVTDGTFSAATDNTGDTDGATGVITGMTDTSDFVVGDYVTVSAGFATTGPFRILTKTATSVTVNANSNAIQANVTVATPDPVFKAMANLAA